MRGTVSFAVGTNLLLVCFSRRIAPFFFYACSGGVAPTWGLHPAPPVSPLTRSRRPGYPLTILASHFSRPASAAVLPFHAAPGFAW